MALEFSLQLKSLIVWLATIELQSNTIWWFNDFRQLRSLLQANLGITFILTGILLCVLDIISMIEAVCRSGLVKLSFSHGYLARWLLFLWLWVDNVLDALLLHNAVVFNVNQTIVFGFGQLNLVSRNYSLGLGTLVAVYQIDIDLWLGPICVVVVFPFPLGSALGTM